MLVQGDANGAAAAANTPTVTPFGAAFYGGPPNNKTHNGPKNHQHTHNDKCAEDEPSPDDAPLFSSSSSSPPPPYYVYGEWQMGFIHVGAVLFGTLLRAATLPSALALAVYWVRSDSSNYNSSSSYDSRNRSASVKHADTIDILSQSLRKMSTTTTTFDHSSSSSSLQFSWHFFGSFFLALVLTSFLLAVVSLVLDLSSKWFLLGRRTIGPHPWDKDSYCQRWQVHGLGYARVCIKV